MQKMKSEEGTKHESKEQDKKLLTFCFRREYFSFLSEMIKEKSMQNFRETKKKIYIYIKCWLNSFWLKKKLSPHNSKKKKKTE